MEKRELSYTVGGNVNYAVTMESAIEVPQKKKKKTKRKRELPYDPAIPLLGMYPEKTIIQKDTYNTVFIAALFTKARTQEQPKCPSTEE